MQASGDVKPPVSYCNQAYHVAVGFVQKNQNKMALGVTGIVGLVAGYALSRFSYEPVVTAMSNHIKTLEQQLASTPSENNLELIKQTIEQFLKINSPENAITNIAPGIEISNNENQKLDNKEINQLLKYLTEEEIRITNNYETIEMPEESVIQKAREFSINLHTYSNPKSSCTFALRNYNRDVEQLKEFSERAEAKDPAAIMQRVYTLKNIPYSLLKVLEYCNPEIRRPGVTHSPAG